LLVYDIDKKRVEKLMLGVDSNLEIDNKVLKGVLKDKLSNSNGLFNFN